MEKKTASKPEQEPLLFYRPMHKNGFLSNFYSSAFKLNGKTYATNEHFFQSQKFVGQPQEASIIDAATPSQAFKLARKHKAKRRRDWEDVKDDIMYAGLTQKFTVHKDLREKLLETGDRELVQHTKNDMYWADGGDGKGLNKLGLLLMKVRNEIRQGKI